MEQEPRPPENSQASLSERSIASLAEEVNLQAILNNSLHAFFFIDPRQEIRAFNSVAEKWAGIMLGQPLQSGDPASRLASCFKAKNFNTALRRAFQGYSTTIRSEMKPLSGETLWFETNFTPVRQDGHGVMGASINMIDITERHRAEAALRENRARFVGIIDSAMDGIITVDEKQRIILFNPAAEQIFRCPANKALGQSLHRFIPDRFHQIHRQHIRNLSQSHVTARPMGQFDKRTALRNDGEEFPIEAAISQITVAGRKFFTVILRDISEKVAAETALRDRELILRSFFDSGTLQRGVVEITGDDILHLSDNVNAARFLGREPEAMRQQLATTLGMPAEYIALWLDYYNRSERSGQPVKFEYNHQTPDGPRTLSVLVSYLGPGDQGRSRFAYIADDVTEHRQTQASLRRLAEQRQQLLEVSRLLLATLTPDEVVGQIQQRLQPVFAYDVLGFYWLDEAGDELYLSPACEEEDCADPKVKNHIPLEQGLLGHVVRSGQGELLNKAHLDPRSIYPAGVEIECEHAICLPVRTPSKLFGGFIVTRNSDPPFTDEEFELMELFVSYVSLALENARLYTTMEARVVRRTAQLKAANQELEAFSYSVSHDLRAPLRHIGGFVQMLQDREEGRLDRRSVHYLEAISQSVDKMQQLIDDLLAFSRLNRAEMHTRAIDLNKLVRDVKQELTATLPAQPPRQVIWQIWPLPVVEGDSALLSVVLTNLLGNAMKYTRPRSEAHIEVGVASAQAQNDQETDCITLFVKDNGVGFDPDYGHKLFGVFQRLHSDDEFEGNGIGLATTKRIIQRHGGKIWATGRPGQGATFYLSLRLARAE